MELLWNILTFNVCILVLCVCRTASVDPCDQEKMTDNGKITSCVSRLQTELNKLDFDLVNNSKIDTFLTLDWSARTTNQKVCCKQFTWSNKGFDLNPLAKSEMKAEDIRNYPEVHLKTTRNIANKQYTIALLDTSTTEYSQPRLPYVHWMVINMFSSNFSVGTHIATYLPPLDPDKNYLFMLWEQSSHILVRMQHFVASENIARCPNDYRCFFSISDFETSNKLTLVSASWLSVKKYSASKSYDIFHQITYKEGNETEICSTNYETEIILDSTICKASEWCDAEARSRQSTLENCLRKNKDYLMKETDLIKDTDNLYLTIIPTWSTSPYTERSFCCNSNPITHSGRSVSVEMMAKNTLMNHETRHVPVLVKYNSSSSAVDLGHGESYAAIILDITVDDMTKDYSNATHPLVHMVVVNLPSQNISNGNPVLQYHTLSRPHKYLWMEYKQTSVIKSSDVKMNKYTKDTACQVKNSCFFNVKSFEADYDLLLVGAVIIDMTHNDPTYYGQQLVNKYNHSANDVCRDYFDYEIFKGKIVCPTPPPSSGTTTIYCYCHLLISLLLSAVLFVNYDSVFKLIYN